MLYQILSGSHFSRNTWKTCDDLRGIQPSRHRMCKARSMWCVSKHALHIMIYACWGKGHCLSHVKNINTLKLLKMYAYTETNIYYHILQYISNILLYIWSSPWPITAPAQLCSNFFLILQRRSLQLCGWLVDWLFWKMKQIPTMNWVMGLGPTQFIAPWLAPHEFSWGIWWHMDTHSPLPTHRSL